MVADPPHTPMPRGGRPGAALGAELGAAPAKLCSDLRKRPASDTRQGACQPALVTTYRCMYGPLSGATIEATRGEGGVVQRVGSDAYVDTGDVDDDGTPIVVLWSD